MINRNTILGALVALVIAGAGATTHAWVGQRDTLTFSGSVAIPGAVLPAGSYVFEMMTAGTSNEVVRIASKTTNQAYFMGFTRSVTRPHADTGRALIVVGESPKGTPPPLRVWYPNGDD